MKNLFLTGLLLSLSTISCSDKNGSAVTEQVPPTESSVMLEEPKFSHSATTVSKGSVSELETDIAEGKSLVEGTDCLSCHKIDSKLIGPAYQDVAAKYTEADIDHLAQKIIDGGKGVWGEIPMTPHAGMSKENAQKMVKYILSLKQ